MRTVKNVTYTMFIAKMIRTIVIIRQPPSSRMTFILTLNTGEFKKLIVEDYEGCG